MGVFWDCKFDTCIDKQFVFWALNEHKIARIGTKKNIYYFQSFYFFFQKEKI